jgi:hypothetical protein
MEQQAQNFTYQEWVNPHAEKGTRDVYVSGVKSFFRITYGSTEDVAILAERNITEHRDGKGGYSRDLLACINSMHERPPMTLETYLARTTQFLLYCCGIEIPKRTGRLLKAKMPK